MLSESAGPIRLGYISLCDDLTAVGATFAAWDAAELADALDRARDVVRLLRANRFPFDAALVSSYARSEPIRALLGIGQLAEDALDGEAE